MFRDWRRGEVAGGMTVMALSIWDQKSDRRGFYRRLPDR